MSPLLVERGRHPSTQRGLTRPVCDPEFRVAVGVGAGGVAALQVDEPLLLPLVLFLVESTVDVLTGATALANTGDWRHTVQGNRLATIVPLSIKKETIQLNRKSLNETWMRKR